MDNITFVTSNDNKLSDAQQALGLKLSRVSLDLDELQDMNLANIVEHKTRQAYAQLQSPVMTEDVGLYLDAWNGFPGPFVKWVRETMGFEGMARMIPDSNRKATWKVSYGYYDGDKLALFEGSVDGRIEEKARGTGSWGFGVYFVPNGEKKTLAELGSEELKYSARAQAIRKLNDYIHSKDVTN